MEESSQGHRTLCATIVLDKNPELLQQRIANKIYETARSGAMHLQGFPDYTPLIAALQNAVPTETPESYQVTVRKATRLVVLKALAEKWLSSDEFGETAKTLIDEHNKHFNDDGEWWAEPEVERPA